MKTTKLCNEHQETCANMGHVGCFFIACEAILYQCENKYQPLKQFFRKFFYSDNVSKPLHILEGSPLCSITYTHYVKMHPTNNDIGNFEVLAGHPEKDANG